MECVAAADEHYVQLTAPLEVAERALAVARMALAAQNQPPGKPAGWTGVRHDVPERLVARQLEPNPLNLGQRTTSLRVYCAHSSQSGIRRMRRESRHGRPMVACRFALKLPTSVCAAVAVASRCAGSMPHAYGHLSTHGSGRQA